MNQPENNEPNKEEMRDKDSVMEESKKHISDILDKFSLPKEEKEIHLNNILKKMYNNNK